MNKKCLLLVAAMGLMLGLGACGAPKPEELIHDAMSDFVIKDTNEATELALTKAADIDVTTEFLLGFDIKNQGVNFSGDAGFYLSGEYKNSGKQEDGSVISFDGKAKLTVPELLTQFGVDIPDNIPLEAYARVNGDCSEIQVYYQDKIISGDESWYFETLPLDMVYEELKDKPIGQEEIDRLTDILINHSKMDKKVVKQGNDDVYVFTFDIYADDEDVIEWMKNGLEKADSSQEVIDKSVAYLKDYGRFIPLQMKYNITKDEHKFSYFYVDFSSIDTNGILRALDNNTDMEQSIKDALKSISVTIKSAYIEYSFNKPGTVTIPEDIVNNAKEKAPQVLNVTTILPSEEDDEEETEEGIDPTTDIFGSYSNIPFALLNLDVFVLSGWEVEDSCLATSKFYPNSRLILVDKDRGSDKDKLNDGLSGYEISVENTEDGDFLPPWAWKDGITFGDSKERVQSTYGSPDIISSAGGCLKYTYTYDGNKIITFYINDGERDDAPSGIVEVRFDYQKDY